LERPEELLERDRLTVPKLIFLDEKVCKVDFYVVHAECGGTRAHRT
jgi:hypothetical protein